MNSCCLHYWQIAEDTPINYDHVTHLIRLLWLTNISIILFLPPECIGGGDERVRPLHLGLCSCEQNKTFLVKNDSVKSITSVWIKIGWRSLQLKIRQLTWRSRLTKGQTQFRVKLGVSALNVSDQLPAGFVPFSLHRVKETPRLVCSDIVLLKDRFFLPIVHDTIH